MFSSNSIQYLGEKPNSAQPGLAPLVPHNLLRLQLQKKSALIDCDTSSAASTAASTAEVMSPPIMQNRKQHLNKLKLALPLKQRLQIVADSSQVCYLSKQFDTIQYYSRLFLNICVWDQRPYIHYNYFLKLSRTILVAVMMEHPNDGYFMRNQGTVVIRWITREFKFPAIIDLGLFSNISHQIMI